MSAFYRFSKEIIVALCLDRPIRDRRWAIWRCTYCVAQIARCDVDEVYHHLADCIGFNRDKKPVKERMPSNDQILKAAGVLIHVRFRLLEKLRSYERKRKSMKLKGKRFPVIEFSQKEFVLAEIERASKKT